MYFVLYSYNIPSLKISSHLKGTDSLHSFFDKYFSSSSFTQALSELIAEQRSDLTDTVEAGRELEGYTDAEPASLPDLGYTDLQRRYDHLKVRPMY